MTAARLLKHFDRVGDAPGSVPRLRRFILDLAVRGKLVAQDPGDEPAGDLLQRIERERAAARSGGTGRERNVPVVLDSDMPFALPANWRWSRLAQIGFLNPRNVAPDVLPSSFVPMTLIPAEYGQAARHEVRPWGDIRSGYTHVANGDVALAKITPCFENGKSAVLRDLTGGIGAGTTELHVVRPILVDADFVLIFLKSPFFIESGVPRMTGTAGQKRVPTEYFAERVFPLPPLQEQRRIVARVNELMTLCDRLEAAQGERETRRDRVVAASLQRLNESTTQHQFQQDARFHLGQLALLTTRALHAAGLRHAIVSLGIRGKLVGQDANDEPALELGSVPSSGGNWSSISLSSPRRGR